MKTGEWNREGEEKQLKEGTKSHKLKTKLKINSKNIQQQAS